MKRIMTAGAIFLFLSAIASAPALAQGRPNPGAGSQGSAVERSAPPPAAPAPSAPPPSSAGSSSGGTSSGTSAVPAGSSGGEHHAAPRAGGSKGAARPRSGGTSAGGGSIAHGGRTGATTGAVNSNDPRATNYGGYARPRGPHPAQGTAAPRDMSPLPPYWHGDYWDYYYWFPYYGPWGLYFYWDPYMWGDYYGGGYYPDASGGQPYDYSGPAGSLKLKVKPRTAQVYVDGYLVGIVDDFDGMFQSLKTQAGGHRLEIRQEGYKSLMADVMVQPDATTTFRGTLEPLKK